MSEFLYKLAKKRNELYNQLSLFTGKGIVDTKKDVMRFIVLNEIIEMLPDEEMDKFKEIEKEL